MAYNYEWSNKPRPWRGRCRAGYSNTRWPPLPRKRAPCQKKMAHKLEISLNVKKDPALGIRKLLPGFKAVLRRYVRTVYQLVGGKTSSCIRIVPASSRQNPLRPGFLLFLLWMHACLAVANSDLASIGLRLGFLLSSSSSMKQQWIERKLKKRSPPCSPSRSDNYPKRERKHFLFVFQNKPPQLKMVH